MIRHGHGRARYTAAMRAGSGQREPTLRRTSSRRAELSPADFFALLTTRAEWSGSDLAATSGITRAAIWKRIEQLRARGLPIRAEAGRGYRLDAAIEPLDKERIAAAIAPELRARVGPIDVFWEIDSTSSALARRAPSSAPCACLAEIQSAGRGRRGRGWQMPLAGGIALSYLRRFDRGMTELGGLSLVAGIAVLRALADGGVDGTALKWPNDIVADDHKLGGILVELGGDALGPCHAIVGIGLNVRVPSAAGAAIGQPWTDLDALCAGAAPSRNLCAGRVLSRLAEAFDAFEAEGFAPFAHEYARHDALRGRPITILHGDASFVAIACGISERGALVIERGGKRLEIDSGEVSVRTAAAGSSDTPCSS